MIRILEKRRNKFYSLSLFENINRIRYRRLSRISKVINFFFFSCLKVQVLVTEISSKRKYYREQKIRTDDKSIYYSYAYIRRFIKKKRKKKSKEDI